MRALIQRVSKASVTINGQVKSEIGCGLLVFLGIENADKIADVEWLCKKIAHLRIFPDDDEVMNKSVMDVGGEVLVVSQFTLQASTKKGNRPSYIKAAKPNVAIPLYESFCTQLERVMERPVKTGEFGADMKVDLLNDGPVTIWMDTQNKE